MTKVKIKEEREEIVRKFRKEKATKNTVRYVEVPAKGEPEVIRTLYVQKWAVGEFEEAPEEIEVIIRL